MNIELMPGLTNVVRFPVELRVAPSMDVIYEIEPDVREVLRVGESFFLEPPEHDLRGRVDAETAAYIAEHVLPLAPHEQRRALDDLLRPVLAKAVGACRKADQVGRHSVEAQRFLLWAQTEGGFWMSQLEENADRLLQEAAELLLLAHRRCQEAHGVNRAVGLARRDEAWMPDSPEAATNWLLAMGEADQARHAHGV